VRERTVVEGKDLLKPFYYRRWYYCLTKCCEVTTHFAEADRVYKNKLGKTRGLHELLDDEGHGAQYEKIMRECRAYKGPCPWED
jgi:hypothetical protein